MQSQYHKKSTILAAKVPLIKNVQGGGGWLVGEANFAINTVYEMLFNTVLVYTECWFKTMIKEGIHLLGVSAA